MLNAEPQFIPKLFGLGFNYVGKDSSFTMRFGIRFQTLMLGSRNVQDDLQLVERSLLNAHYDIDRDMGIQLSHYFKIRKQVLV